MPADLCQAFGGDVDHGGGPTGAVLIIDLAQ
jgi:hypothetical protein